MITNDGILSQDPSKDKDNVSNTNALSPKTFKKVKVKNKIKNLSKFILVKIKKLFYIIPHIFHF